MSRFCDHGSPGKAVSRSRTTSIKLMAVTNRFDEPCPTMGILRPGMMVAIMRKGLSDFASAWRPRARIQGSEHDEENYTRHDNRSSHHRLR
jgi:hypothetical protein